MSRNATPKQLGIIALVVALVAVIAGLLWKRRSRKGT